LAGKDRQAGRQGRAQQTGRKLKQSSHSGRSEQALT
jgi:hypothetical protein